jgi:hypothetical protein
VIGGPLGAINNLFPAARKITRPVAAAAQQADPTAALAQGSGAVLGGLFKDLGLGSSTPSPGGLSGAQASPDGQTVSAMAQSSPIFTRDGGNSSLGADQTISGGASVNDHGVDAMTSTSSTYANPMQPGSTASMNAYGQNAAVTPDASTDASGNAGLDLTGTANATAPPVPDPTIPQNPGFGIDNSMADAVAAPDAIPVADSGPTVDPVSFDAGGGF